MGLVLQVLMIVALLVCDSHQLRTRRGTASVWEIAVPNPLDVIPGINGFSTGMGPYYVDVKIFRQCDDPGVNLVNQHLEVYNSKTENGSKILYRGNFTVPFTQAEVESLRVKLRVIRLKDQKQFEFLKYEENMCLTCIGLGKGAFESVKKQLGIMNDEPCTIPMGTYSFSNWEPKAELPPPVLEYGTYRAILELIYDHQTFACVDILTEVKQKYY